MAEKRHFQRTDFETSGILRVRGRPMSFTLIDISLKGALLNPYDPEAIPIGESVTIEIALKPSELVIRAEARCVHREYNYLGFRFTVIDADSMAHLRRLMELNLGDDSEIDHELSFLAEQAGGSGDAGPRS